MMRCGCLAAAGVFAVIVLAISSVLSLGIVDLSGNAAPVSADGWVKPVAGATVSQGFGCTNVSIEPYNASCPSRHFHSGVDLAVAAGTPIRAAASGVVRVVVSTTGFGLHVIIDHGNGLQSLYGHMSVISVEDGAAVSAGDVIGEAGSTGNSTGPHLHFEIDRDGIPENPLNDLSLP
jgi:murein DD-endopeptidase MepM/ murein hydrolase activator NlpD